MELSFYSAHPQQDFADVLALFHRPVGRGSVRQREYSSVARIKRLKETVLAISPDYSIARPPTF